MLSKESMRERIFWAGILTFEEASRRSISSSRFLCSSICFPASPSSSQTCLAFRLGSCSGSTNACDGKLLLLLSVTRTFSSRGKTIDLSPVRSEEAAASRPMVWRKSWRKLTIQNDRLIVFRVLQCFCILFCMRSALATTWQPRT